MLETWGSRQHQHQLAEQSDGSCSLLLPRFAVQGDLCSLLVVRFSLPATLDTNSCSNWVDSADGPHIRSHIANHRNPVCTYSNHLLCYIPACCPAHKHISPNITSRMYRMHRIHYNFDQFVQGRMDGFYICKYFCIPPPSHHLNRIRNRCSSGCTSDRSNKCSHAHSLNQIYPMDRLVKKNRV